MRGLPSSDLLDAARHARRRGEWERAEQAYLAHLRNAWNDAEVLAEYGDVCLQRGHAQAACWYLHRAATLRPAAAAGHLRLAYAQLRDRNLAEALASFNAILAASPDEAHALNGLGLCHLFADEPAKAAATFERAVAIAPSEVQILVNGAEARLKAGDSAGALAWIEQAVRHESRPMVMIHARYLRENGQHAQALALLDALPPQERARPATIFEYASCLRESGRNAEAIDRLATLARIAPESAEFHEEMGRCLAAPAVAQQRHAHWLRAAHMLLDAHKLGRARILLERLLEEDGAHAQAWTLLGIVHLVAVRNEPAQDAFRRAIAADASAWQAYWQLGHALEQHNRIPEARQVIDDAMRLRTGAPADEDDFQLHLVACRLARREGRLDRAQAELDALSTFRLSDTSQLLTTFERARLLDRLERPADAMDAYIDGNAQAQRMWLAVQPGPNRYLAEVEELHDLVRGGWLENWPAPLEANAPAEPDPVFVVGFPRSGTTLLEQILDGNTHAQVLKEEATAAGMRKIVDALPDRYPRAIRHLDAIDLDFLRGVYFQAVAACCRRDRARLLIDKMPLQMNRAALIQRVFPRARWVFLTRHPADVVLSCFQQNFTPNMAMTNFYSLDDTVRLYLRTMELWDAFRSQLHLSVHALSYERLIADPVAETRDVCDFLGLPWQAEQLLFAERARTGIRIATPSYEQVSQPLNPRAIGRWERYRAWLEPYLPQLQPWIERYG
ncbi:MAG: sulfotransferase [Proteobacteria bacterium]|nr:sulfotransferase [Pseudomonadota bacterium]